jgi:hypothetical protein
MADQFRSMAVPSHSTSFSKLIYMQLCGNFS